MNIHPDFQLAGAQRPAPIKPATAHGCKVGKCKCPTSYRRCALYTNEPWNSHDSDCLTHAHVYARCPKGDDE